MRELPGFAVGGDTLANAEHFSAVHAGAVFPGHAVATVILIVAMWAVAAAFTGCVHILEIMSMAKCEGAILNNHQITRSRPIFFLSGD